MVRYLSVLPHHRAADFGCGSGAYTAALIERVGAEGRVYALDALPQAVAAVQREARRAGRACMALCTEFEQRLPLADNLLDRAVLANTLHGVDPLLRASFVADIARTMKTGAAVLVVDWADSFKNMGPPAPLVVTPTDAVRLFRGAGFITGDMLPAGTHQYAFVATLGA